MSLICWKHSYSSYHFTTQHNHAPYDSCFEVKTLISYASLDQLYKSHLLSHCEVCIYCVNSLRAHINLRIVLNNFTKNKLKG